MNTTVHALNDEDLVHIFQYIETGHLIVNVYEVCDRWKELIAKDPRIWSKRWLVYNLAKPVTALSNSLHKVPLLRRLRFCTVWDSDFQIKLHDYCSMHYSNCTKAAEEILRKVPQLSMLEYNIELPFSILLQQNLTFCSNHYNSLAKLKVLETLKLNSAFTFCGNNLKNIADQCDRLKQLHLPESNRLDTSDVLYFLEKKKTQIETLELSGYLLTDEAFHTVTECTNLQELRIHYSGHMSFPTLYKIVHSHIKVVQLFRLKFQYDVPTSVKAGRVIELVKEEVPQLFINIPIVMDEGGME